MSTLISAQRRAVLEDAARDAADRSRSPYSKFRVGAAVLTESGRVFTAANIESASYSLGLCAERLALAAAIHSSRDEVVALAVACLDVPLDAPLSLRSPCGACRQWIFEFAPNAQVFIAGEAASF